jgi:hypothetical protein
MAKAEVLAVIAQFKIDMAAAPSVQTDEFVRPGGWLWNRHPAGYKDSVGELESMIDDLSTAAGTAYDE